MRVAGLVALTTCLACGGMDTPECTLQTDTVWELIPQGVCSGLNVGTFTMAVTATGAVGRPGVFDVCSGVPETTSRASNFIEVERVCARTSVTFTLQCATSTRGRGLLLYVQKNAAGLVDKACRLGYVAVRVEP